jgi:RNA polymerase sigma-70 factor (ECF subfamily)
LETSVSLLDRLAGSPSESDWRRMVELYQPLLRTWCLRAGVSDADADDLCQETLTAVVRDVSRFERRNPGAFRAWMRGILANRLKGFFRDRKTRPIATGTSDFVDRLHELEASDSSLSQEWDREHDRHLAARIMTLVQHDFTPATWQAFRRLVLEGAAPTDVAAELGLSVNAVLLAKSRVLKRLRSELSGFVDC